MDDVYVQLEGKREGKRERWITRRKGGREGVRGGRAGERSRDNKKNDCAFPFRHSQSSCLQISTGILNG